VLPSLSFFKKQKMKLKEGLSTYLLVCALLCTSTAVTAQDQPDYLVRSAMIFKILQYVSWPDEDKFSAYRVAFVGDENPLYEELLKAAKTIRVKGKPLIVFKTDVGSIDANSNQVVYLGASHVKSMAQVANNIRKTNTLLISNQATNLHDLMINFLSINNNALSFEMNRSNIIFEKLVIYPNLLLLGGTEIDVAELFRETQLALQLIKLDLFEKENQLKQTSRTLAKEQQQIKQQKQQMQTFKAEIASQEAQLKTRATQLDKLNLDVTQTSESLQDQQSKLTTREKRNTEQLNRLRDQGVKVAFLNEQIVEKEAFLAAKQEELESMAGINIEQEGAIVSQKKVLVLAFSTVFVFAGLIIFSLWVNASRKQANKQLQQSQANMVMLGGIGRDLTANVNLNAVIEQVYQSLNKVLDAHIFTLGILQKDKNCIHMPLVVEDEKKGPAVDFDLNDQSLPAAWCVNHQQELIINDHQQWQQHFNQPMPQATIGKQMTTVVYMPLIIGDKIVGCLSLQSPEPNAYSEQQLDMTRTLSRYTAIAVDNALSHAELALQKRKSEAQNAEIVAAGQQQKQSQKMASLGLLTSGVATEINEPANFTHTATFLIEKEIIKIKAFLTQLAGGQNADNQVLKAFDDNFAKLTELSQTAQLGSKRIKTIVDNVRTFAHDTQDSGQLMPIGEQLKSTIVLLKSQHPNTDINITSQLTDLQLCFPAKLGQVFMNLTVNACQAIEHKKQQQPQLKGQIEISSVQTNGHLTITVKDNGCIMDETTQQKLFNPCDITRTEGTVSGLGMTICASLVKELGGDIKIASTNDTGTELSVSLPV
jgi:signal transduction histidine kinase